MYTLSQSQISDLRLSESYKSGAIFTPLNCLMAGQEFFFVKIEGPLEPVVLKLGFRVRSNAVYI